MVYRGKPSTGCKKCRQRKIKCDERPGGCLKCSEKGFACPGYESALDRMFQDESAHVGEKARKSKQKAIATRDEKEVAARSLKALGKIKDAIGMALLCPLIDQGIAYFMMNHAIGMDQPPMQSNSYHEHLSTHGFHPIIATSMTALGLAGVSNLRNDPALKREAMQWYGNALGMANTALASPKDVKSDNTLLATMMLSMFEALSNENSFSAWSSHVEGSASLLRLRGAGQFSTPAGKRMYMQTVGLFTMDRMAQGLPLPEFIHDLNREIAKVHTLNDPNQKFLRLHIAIVEFRASILRGSLTDFQGIIDGALEIDHRAQAIFENAGPDWEYERVRTSDMITGVFGDYYHIYPHMTCAQTWNWLRHSRIYIHDIIRNTILAGYAQSPPRFVGEEYARLLQESTQTLYEMQSDILASIPQYLHDTPNSPMRYGTDLKSLEHTLRTTPVSSPAPGQSPKTFFSNFIQEYDNSAYKMGGIAKDRLPVLRVSGGYSSLWVFYIAGATAVATPESQKFVLKSLARIGAEFGVNQAKLLAGALQLKMKQDALNQRPFQIVPWYLPLEHVS